jgi:hypothetical protein
LPELTKANPLKKRGRRMSSKEQEKRERNAIQPCFLIHRENEEGKQT